MYQQADDQGLKKIEAEKREEHKKLREEIDKIEKEVNSLQETKRALGGTPAYKQHIAEVDRRLAKVKSALKAISTRSKPDEIHLNTWAAEDLGASVGDIIAVTYYSVSTDEEYITETVAFPVSKDSTY